MFRRFRTWRVSLWKFLNIFPALFHLRLSDASWPALTTFFFFSGGEAGSYSGLTAHSDHPQLDSRAQLGPHGAWAPRSLLAEKIHSGYQGKSGVSAFSSDVTRPYRKEPVKARLFPEPESPDISVCRPWLLVLVSPSRTAGPPVQA